MNSAVLFLVFNRMDTTRRVFESIKNARPPRIYLASDGPRSSRSGEKDIVEAVRKWVLDSIDWPCEIQTLFRESNQGCGKAVSGAIEWFFENEECGIILEDDCIPDATFFEYCDELLMKYRDEPSVMMISGANFLFEESIIISNSYYFSKYQMIWGWATWKRAWSKYDFKMKHWPEFRDNGGLRKMHLRLDEQKFWYKIFEQMTGAQPVDTWDFQWLFALWASGGCCVCPSQNLVNNVGYGADATHTTSKSRNNDMDVFPMVFPMNHPSQIMMRKLADNITCDNFFIGARRYRYWIGYPWMRLGLIMDEFMHWVNNR